MPACKRSTGQPQAPQLQLPRASLLPSSTVSSTHSSSQHCRLFCSFFSRMGWLEAAVKMPPQSLLVGAVLDKQNVPQSSLSGQPSQIPCPCAEGYHPYPTDPSSTSKPFSFWLWFLHFPGVEKSCLIIFLNQEACFRSTSLCFPQQHTASPFTLLQHLLQSKSWNTDSQGRSEASPYASSAFERPIIDHEPSQARKWEQRNKRRGAA